MTASDQRDLIAPRSRESEIRRQNRSTLARISSETGSVLSDLVTALGYETHWVSHSASALQEVVQTPPDVVLLEILIPGRSGLDVLPSLRALAPGVPVLMVSGTADADLARQALARGAFDYIVKPVEMRRLGEVIDLAL